MVVYSFRVGARMFVPCSASYRDAQDCMCTPEENHACARTRKWACYVLRKGVWSRRMAVARSDRDTPPLLFLVIDFDVY